jgi:S1-C subfamily serine protease
MKAIPRQGDRTMKRSLAAVAIAAVVGGVAGGSIAIAADGSGASSAAPAPATAARSGALTAADLYRRDAPAVAVITASETQRSQPDPFLPPTSETVQSLGSGFVIDRRGDIVTNDHVVSGATQLRVGFGGGASYSAHVVGADASTDLAVIRLDTAPAGLHPLAFDDSSGIRPGDPVYAIGNPFGLDRTMTAGIVSATGRDIQAPNGLTIPDSIQTDAPINHGNSGGPLLDATGHVVGVTSQIQGGTVDANVGVGFAIPSDTAKAVARQLIAHGRATHPWIGLGLATLDPTIAAASPGLPSHGVLVTRVAAGGPAARAGIVAASRQTGPDGTALLRDGDAIVALDGTPVRTSEQLADAIARRLPGERIALRVVHAGHARDVTVTVGDAPVSRS